MGNVLVRAAFEHLDLKIQQKFKEENSIRVLYQ